MRHWWLPGILLLLAISSITILQSIAPRLVVPQLVFFLLAGGVYVATSRLPFHWWRQLSGVLFAGLNVGLLLPLFFGAVTRGSSRWIPIGSYHIQPSQLAVPIGALFLAEWARRHPLNTWKNLASFLGLAMIPAALIMLEPDLGTTVIYLAAVGTIIFFSSITPRMISTVLMGVLATSVIAWLFVLQPYQKGRILSFVAPEADLSGAGYNARQSLIAVGSGQVIGKGLGQGIQSHLRFLPERQTDFIFASLAEELGFAGALIIVFLYGLLYYLIIQQSDLLENTAAAWFVMAMVTMLTIQTVVHIGMNMGLFPITGITLPFISYGGSSILSLAFGFGLIGSAIGDQTAKPRLSIS